MSLKQTTRCNIIQHSLLLVIRGYKSVISPFLPDVCRYHPSCSAYASEAIVTHGALRGIGLAAWRLCRCHPLADGGFDPVPPCAHGRDTHQR